MPKLFKSLVAAATVVALAACAQLPKSSEIKIGPDIKSDSSADYLYYSPPGPSTGETQQDILDGFLNAGTGPQNDYEVARKYLAQGFRSKWNPNDEVLIQEGTPQISFGSSQTARVSVQVQASVDADGHYQVMDAGTTRMLDFQMVRENGEWRISQAPNLTILIRPVFDVIFKSYSIYFYDQPRTHLVPDLRWFPSRASTATRMINALLDGPSQWLKPAVVSAIPVGTALSLSSVTVANGVAAVDLNAKVLSLKAPDKQLMKAQIRATLSQLPNVYGVSISVERGPQEILDRTDVQPSKISGNAVILTGDQLESLNSDGSSPVAGSQSLVQKFGATDFAITNAQDWVALKNTFGVYRARLGIFAATPKLIDSRPGLLAPSFDAYGYLWTVPKQPNQPILVTATDDARSTLKPGWIDSYPRRQFAISAEGSRIAFLVGSGTSVSVEVAAIIRNSSGLPIGLAAPLEVVKASDSPIAVSWSDENTLAVLTNQGSGSATAEYVSIGGSSTQLGSIDSAKLIAAQNAADIVYAIDSAQNLYEYKNLNWSLIDIKVLAVHFAN
jgi:Lipoprotein LpqB beta-propeller domain/Sporulation and spore germination